MTFFQALLLGLVQGLTEFFPISSSAHLRIVKHFLGIADGERLLYFDLLCHAGTLIALLLFLKNDLFALLRDIRKMALMVLALFPLVPAYFLLKPVRLALSDPAYLGYCLMATSLLLFLATRQREQLSAVHVKGYQKRGSPQHVMLERCEAQVGEMQGAAKRFPEAANPETGWRCRATQQIARLREQLSAVHVKGYQKRGSPQHVMLERCEAQVGEMQGAAKRFPEAANPETGWRCRATQQIARLREQLSAVHVKGYQKRGSPQHVMLERCEAQVGEMQGAAKRFPEAANPETGWRCRATQQIARLREQLSAVHVKGYQKKKHVLCIGLAQAAALIPGISRSGSTMAMARFCGWEWKDAARFSFLLAVPAILGGEFLETMKLFRGHSEALGAVSGSCYAAGFVMSLLVGLVSVRVAFALYEKGTVRPFAWYCLAAGVGAWLVL